MKKLLTKRIVAVILTIVALFSFGLVSYADQTPITVFIDGEQLTFDVNPIIEDGRTLVPMRVIFEALGAEVDWNPDTWTAIATKNDIKIEISIDSTQMLKNGEAITLDVPARLIDSRTLVPVRAVSEGLGAKVDWNDTLWQVIITTIEPTAPETEVTVPEADETVDTPNVSTTEEKTEYLYTELSPADMTKLKQDVAQLRYAFEQNILPTAFINDAVYAKGLITKSDKDLMDIVYSLWERFVVSQIIEIQIDSQDAYVFQEDAGAELTEEDLLTAYLSIVGEAGLNAKSLFNITYDTTPGGKPLMLITFNNAEELLNCKYIAIVAVGDTIRYFTCEKTLSDIAESDYMFCEITLNSRGSYDTVNDKTSFFQGIDSVISTK